LKYSYEFNILNWQKSGFVRPVQFFIRSCPVRPDRFQLWMNFSHKLLEVRVVPTM